MPSCSRASGCAGMGEICADIETSAQYSPIGQESKEELADVYRLDTAGKGLRIRRRRKSEGRSQNKKTRTTNVRFLLPPSSFLTSSFLLLHSDFVFII